MKIYSDQDIGGRDAAYVPEKARAIYKRSRVLRLQRRTAEADVELEEAVRLREQVLGAAETREIEALTDAEFDDLIAYWSK